MQIVIYSSSFKLGYTGLMKQGEDDDDHLLFQFIPQIFALWTITFRVLPGNNIGTLLVVSLESLIVFECINTVV